MKPIVIAVALALAGAAAPVLAQDATQTVPANPDPVTPAYPADPANPATPVSPATPATPATPADPSLPVMPEQASGSVHTTTEYHGPHTYPAVTRGRGGDDPPVIDHSADTLVVEPTHSTITIAAPIPPQ